MRIRVMAPLALALLLGSCRPPPTVSSGATTWGGPLRTASSGLIDDLGRPRALDDPEETSLRQAILARVDRETLSSTPTVGRLRLPLAERPTIPIGRHQLYAMAAHRNLDVAEPRKGQTNERLLRIEPAMTLDPDGTATLTFETLRPISGASAYLGYRIPSDPLGRPRYRRRASGLARSVETDTGYRHQLSTPVHRLLRSAYDVGRVLEKGRGVLVWRLELVEGRSGTSFVFDGETAFRCNDCRSRKPTFVQLPSLRLGPFVDLVGKSQATVSFDTDAATAAWLAVLTEDRVVTLVPGPAPGTKHEIQLTNLEPGTRYRYQPIVVDKRGELHIHSGGTLETEPEGLSKFEFVALSDSRSGFGTADAQYGGTNADVLGDLLQMAVVRGRPRAVVFVGDLIDGYTTWPRSFAFQLEMWKRAVQSVHGHIPIYEAMGNHEALLDFWTHGFAADRQNPSAEAAFAAQFVNPLNAPTAKAGAPSYAENTYSFDIGTAHLAVVNSNYHFRSHPGQPGHPAGPAGNREGWLDEATLAWLDQDLARARQGGQKHLFVFTHEPGFPNGGHVSDGLYWNGEVPEVLERRARLYAIMGRHEVTAIVHGDEHNYSRLLVDEETLGAPLNRPIWHLVSGGAGAPFYAQNKSVPWAKQVAAFDARQHFLRFRIDGEDCIIEAMSREGGLIDRFDAADGR